MDPLTLLAWIGVIFVGVLAALILLAVMISLWQTARRRGSGRPPAKITRLDR